MYCPKCGAQNPDDASFCLKCGIRIGPSGGHEVEQPPSADASTRKIQEISLKIEIKLDPEAQPTPTPDDVIDGVKKLLSIGMEGIGRVPFEVRDVTLLM